MKQPNQFQLFTAFIVLIYFLGVGMEKTMNPLQWSSDLLFCFGGIVLFGYLSIELVSNLKG